MKFIRVRKTAYVEKEEGETFNAACERANTLDSNGALEFDLYFDPVKCNLSTDITISEAEFEELK